MIHTKSRRPANRVFMPHLGNILNEVMNTSLENIVKNTPKSTTTPSVNVIKNDHAYALTMALPGYKKEDVQIQVEKNLLIISSQKELQKEEDDKTNFRLREFNYGNFERKFHLPENVDQEKLEARFENGLLHLTLTIKPEEQPKSIVIQ